MVLPHSHKIPRVSCYSGYPPLSHCFVYRNLTFYVSAFQLIQLTTWKIMQVHTPVYIAVIRFGLFRFRSPLLTESLICFLFLWVIRCFSSPGSLHYTMYSCNDTITLLMVSSLIRISTAQCLFATPRSFSQLVTSFFGAMYQGILLYALCSLIFFWLHFCNPSNLLTFFPWLYSTNFLVIDFLRFYFRINLSFF